MSKSFISPSQCRMARALLQWSQPELAERCGLATMTISKFEKDENSRPEARTVSKIAAVFEMAEVAFTEDGGVKPDQNMVTILEGEDADYRLLDDVYATLKETKGETLIAGVSEIDESAGEYYKFIKAHIERLLEAGISERILIRKGDTNLIGPSHWYRCLPDDYFSDTPFQVYGNRIAMIDIGPPQKIVIIENERFKNTFYSLFNAAWDQAEKL